MSDNGPAYPYTHEPLGEEIVAVGGHYVISREEVVDVGGRRLLYVVGAGVFDTSCCGSGGYAFALVPGWVDELRGETDGEGRPVSRVRRVRGEAVRKEIEALVRAREHVTQVNFL